MIGSLDMCVWTGVAMEGGKLVRGHGAVLKGRRVNCRGYEVGKIIEWNKKG